MNGKNFLKNPFMWLWFHMIFFYTDKAYSRKDVFLRLQKYLLKWCTFIYVKIFASMIASEKNKSYPFL